MSSTKSNPMLTIIIPTYNSAATIGIALESIIYQTFQNTEVLIIDGLSCDNTIEIAKKYQLEFPQIKIISEADKGIYDAMNKGIGIAKGEWVYFMGSDDFLYESTTIEQFSKIEELKKFEVLYGNVYSKRFNGIYDRKFTYSKLATKNICHQSIFFRKCVFKKIGKFNLKYEAYADWDHNIRWFFSNKISHLYVNQVVANYADGGFSSLNVDEVFNKDKNIKLLLRGIGKIPPFQLISICNNAITRSKQDDSIILVGIWYCVKYSFEIAKKLGMLKGCVQN